MIRPKESAPLSTTTECKQEFGSVQITKALGISGRQLQWWDERGVLKPRHAGHRRFYSRDDVIALWAVKQLRQRGLSLQSVRKVLRQMRKQFEPFVPDIVNGGRVLVITTTDGRGVQCFAGGAAPLDHVIKMTDPAVVISVGPELWRLLMPTGGRRREVA